MEMLQVNSQMNMGIGTATRLQLFFFFKCRLIGEHTGEKLLSVSSKILRGVCKQNYKEVSIYRQNIGAIKFMYSSIIYTLSRQKLRITQTMVQLCNDGNHRIESYGILEGKKN